MVQEQMKLTGTLEGHTGWVTQIPTFTRNDKTIVLSSFRGKTILDWDVDNIQSSDAGQIGRPVRSLNGHNHVVISSDGQFALSCSWDKTLRLWDLKQRVGTLQFISDT